MRRSCVLLLMLLSARASAEVHQLAPGVTELGLGGTFVSVEGSSTAEFELRLGRFFTAPGASLWNVEAQLGYARVLELDRLDTGLSLGWTPILKDSPLHPFLAVGLGLRQEWLGSFSQARYPVGIDVGCRAMAGRRVLVRAEYRFRRLMADPVEDFDEHRFLMGLSLLWR